MVQNLKDAGCSAQTIEKVCRLYGNGQVQDAIKTLRKHRCGLMDSLHESQERVDCLDFLVWQMEKEYLKNNKKEREALQNGKYYKTGINKGMG
ncbi:hypothetical protein [Parablautia intestinalis]|uniref:hypothetical protein n=1 Tax=Parablautia intestinalis TaxID=2320100 RepID=UPI00256EE3E4|nr:hypothetical protein [Parablautia intestinalis]